MAGRLLALFVLCWASLVVQPCLAATARPAAAPCEHAMGGAGHAPCPHLHAVQCDGLLAVNHDLPGAGRSADGPVLVATSVSRPAPVPAAVTVHRPGAVATGPPLAIRFVHLLN